MRLTAIVPAIVLCSLAALVGCSTPDPRVFDGRVDKLQTSLPAEDRAIVIFRAELYRDTSLWGRIGEVGSMYFRLKEPVAVTEKDKVIKKVWFEYYSGEDLRAASIYPGEYAIERVVQYRDSSSTRTLNATAWDSQTGAPSVFGFSVASGEVVYLGHLDIGLRKDRAYRAALSVSDRQDEVRKYVKQEFGGKADSILAKMQTRLLEVPAEAW